ncbi:hypothetical protein D3C85_1674570 [compost metagenome]
MRAIGLAPTILKKDDLIKPVAGLDILMLLLCKVNKPVGVAGAENSALATYFALVKGKKVAGVVLPDSLNLVSDSNVPKL